GWCLKINEYWPIALRLLFYLLIHSHANCRSHRYDTISNVQDAHSGYPPSSLQIPFVLDDRFYPCFFQNFCLPLRSVVLDIHIQSVDKFWSNQNQMAYTSPHKDL